MAKVRSPNYPAIDLGVALEAVRPAWKAEHRNKMSRAVLARHLGYSSLNGRALGKIGAVRAYGLIDGSGDDLRISDDAVTALASPDKVNFQYRDAMERLALKPTLFSDIKKQFPASLPSEANLTYWLAQNGFTQDAAGKAAKAFLATMRLVYDDASDYTPMDSPKESEEMSPAAVAEKLLSERPDGVKRLMLQEVFNLDEGPVTLTYPSDLSPESYLDLKDHLDLFLRKAKRRAEAMKEMLE
jgi:hypothetical protein